MADDLSCSLNKIAALADAGKFEEALQGTENVLEQFPSRPEVWQLRAHIFRQQGDIGRAINERTKAIELSGKEPHYFYMRGIDLFGLGKYEQAVSDFTKIIELCDYYKSDYYREGAYFFRADAYVRLKEYELARADCARVRDDFRTWTDRIRTKTDILAECS